MEEGFFLSNVAEHGRLEGARALGLRRMDCGRRASGRGILPFRFGLMVLHVRGSHWGHGMAVTMIECRGRDLRMFRSGLGMLRYGSAGRLARHGRRLGTRAVGI